MKIDRPALLVLVVTSILCGSATLHAAHTLTVIANHGSVRVYPDKEQYDEGERVRLTPRPEPGYCFDRWSGGVSSERLVTELVMDGNKSVTAHFKTWAAPIGIPSPSFGITETYRMYDTVGNRNPALTYNASPDAGYYTHYVDSTHASATNTNNDYGSPTTPRLTVPFNLPAGSIVEIHNIASANGWGEFNVTGTGTSAMPIFVRGVGSPTVDALLDVGYYGNASYIIVEGIGFPNGAVLGRQNGTAFETNHICIRDCEFTHSTGTSATSWTDNSLSDIVFYANIIHDNGTWDPNEAEGDEDSHGISIGAKGTRVWAVDNEMYHNSGDGIQINGTSALNHIYIGRNIAWQNKQTGFWTKTAEDVVFSENVAYLHRPSTSASGAGMGFQYDPKRVWFLCNTSFDNTSGFGTGSGNLGGREELYFLGNVVYGCTNGMLLNGVYPPDPSVLAANTIYDCTDGIVNGYYNCKLDIENNILVCSRYYTNFPSDYATAANSDFGTNLVYGGSGLVWGIAYSNLADFQSGTSEGAGSIEADPLFVGASSYDLHLQASSPVINVGSGSGALQTAIARFDTLYNIDIRKDIEGRARPQGSGWDIGAYEYVVAAVSGLASSGVSRNSVSLSWTVPGEEGSTGTPASYDIRYAGSAISEANWEDATEVQGEPLPGAFGTSQSFTVVGLNPGATYYFAMKVLDSAGHASLLSNVVSETTASSGNSAPVLTTIGAKSVLENATLTFTLAAADADVGDVLSYSAAGLPTGATFNAATQTFTWTPTDDQEGNYHATFQVSDGHVAVSETIAITVLSGSNHPPVLAAIGNKSVSENQTLSFTVSATDVDGNPLTYSVSGLPAGASFANRVFTWTPGFNQAGNHSVTFTVSDGQAEDSETITIAVANVNRPPVLASIGGKQVDENFSLSFSTSATDPDGDSVTYSATGLPAGATFVAGVFTWVPSFTQAGTHSVTFTASDGSLTDTEQVTITVGNVADETAPVVAGLSPAAGAVQTPINPLIALSVSDGGRGVDANSVTIQVDGQLVYSGNQATYESDHGVCRRTGTKASYRYHFAPSSLFGREQEVSVRVTAKDLANNVMTPYVYHFVTEMQSFGQNCTINAGSLACAHPAVATDSQGNLWTVWDCGQAGDREIYAAKHGGQTVFAGTPVRLTNLAGDRCDPVVAVAPDDVVYVAWQDNRRGNWDIYVSRSSDGVTWQNAVCVTDSNDNQTRPAIAVDGANPPRVYVAYEDDGAGNQNICVTSSTTSFATKTTTQVTSHATNQTEPALAVGAGNVAYVVWTDARNGLTDIYGASSASWTNVAFVTGSGDQHSPALAVEPGTSVLHLVWCDDAVGGSDILHAGSTGLPGSPLAGTCIVDDTSNAGQSAPAIIAVRDSFDNTHVYVCWQDYRSAGDTADSDLYFAEIRSGVAGTNILVGDGGANSDQSEPALGFDQHGEPVILWTDDAGGTTRICGARATHFAPTAWASSLITRAAGGRVGPATVDGVEDVSLVLPANAYECDVTFTISRMYNPQWFGPGCVAGCEIGPSGVEFSVPVTVTIPYDASGTGLAVPYWYDPQTGTLSQQGISQITTATAANGTPLVSFKTTHLTSFYVLDGEIRRSNGGGGGGGGGCALSNSRDGDVLGYLLPYAAMALFVLVLRQKDRMRREL
jgi:hypothetical protein